MRIDAVHMGDLHSLDNQTKFPTGLSYTILGAHKSYKALAFIVYF
jgi:hypothetical protein